MLPEKLRAFPLVLHEMLEDAEVKGFQEIVSWNAEGTGFRVHDRDLFMKHIISHYFRQTRYKSFQRQLHLYGFSRVTGGKARGWRFHPLLVRGKKDLALHMKPKRSGNQSSPCLASSNPVNRSMPLNAAVAEVQTSKIRSSSHPSPGLKSLLMEIQTNGLRGDDGHSNTDSSSDLSFDEMIDQCLLWPIDFGSNFSCPLPLSDLDLTALEPIPLREVGIPYGSEIDPSFVPMDNSQNPLSE